MLKFKLAQSKRDYSSPMLLGSQGIELNFSMAR